MARSRDTRDRGRDGEGNVVDVEVLDELPAGDDDGESEDELAADEALGLPPEDDDEAGGELVVDLDGDGDGAGDPIVEAGPAASPRRARGRGASKPSLVKHDPMAAYISEIRRYGLLSREQEHGLAVKWVEEGDTDAARRLIEANLRLVVKIAYEYRRAHKNLLDLVQEGNIGLMQAVRKYDPYRGVKLSSYAAWWIRAYILKFILNNWRLVKLGTTQAQRKLFFNLRKEKERLEQQGFQPTPELLAERLDVREKDVVEMDKRLSAPDASMDAPLPSGDTEGMRTRHDLLAGQESGRPDVQVEQSQFSEILRDKLEAFAETLEGREATIFRERWLTETPLTLQQIGDRYGVSRERARQIEKRMLGRLRTYLEAELGTAVDIDSLSRD